MRIVSRSEMTTDHIDGSLFANADNLNIDSENRVIGRHTDSTYNSIRHSGLLLHVAGDLFASRKPDIRLRLDISDELIEIFNA